ASLVMVVLALAPGLPFLPFATLGATMAFVAYIIPKRRAEVRAAAEAHAQAAAQAADEEARTSVKEQLRAVEIELCLGKQLSSTLLPSHNELAQRVSKMRRSFARQYGFVVPDIKLTDDLTIPPKSYQIKIHGTVVAGEELRLGDVLVITGDGPMPDVPGEEAREPAFGMKAMWVSEAFVNTVTREGFKPVDNMSVLLTHLREVIRNNLSQLLSYKDMRALLDRLEPEYRRLLDEIVPSQLSYSGLQAVLKLLLAERISIRNLHLILEAIAEVAPHVRRAEQLAEHVRMRMAQQICGDLSDGGVLKVLRLGNRWDMAFHQALKRDAKGEVIEFDIDPRLIEQFGAEASKVIRAHMEQGHQFVLVVAPDARPYVRMVTERLFATLPVLSHLEIARGVQIKALGAIS
ncbi:MAG: FHIPEP family type III secretion protein, partial [Hyphomicrobiaceae bacterium]